MDMLERKKNRRKVRINGNRRRRFDRSGGREPIQRGTQETELAGAGVRVADIRIDGVYSRHHLAEHQNQRQQPAAHEAGHGMGISQSMNVIL